MRFRTVEDERVYNALRIEIFLRLGVHLPPIVMNEVLRNFGKIEGLLYGEGIRQGMAVAEVASRLSPDTENPDGSDELLFVPALVAHAIFYQDANTPLARVETARLAACEKSNDTAAGRLWLDASPLPFAPQTLAEATKLYGPELEPAAVTHRTTPTAAVAAPQEAGDDAEEEDDESVFDGIPDFEDLHPDDKKKLSDAIMEKVLAKLRRDATGDDGIDDPDPASAEPLMTRDASPDFLDRVRDELKHMLNNGWKPMNWQELILGLHHRMQTDAAALDLQLSGHLGRTVLAQVGLFDIAPPSMVMTGEDGGIRFSDNLADLMR